MANSSPPITTKRRFQASFFIGGLKCDFSHFKTTKVVFRTTFGVGPTPVCPSDRRRLSWRKFHFPFASQRVHLSPPNGAFKRLFYNKKARVCSSFFVFKEFFPALSLRLSEAYQILSHLERQVSKLQPFLSK